MGVPETVLVAEDDAAIRRSLKQMLERESYPVNDVGSLEEALSCVRAANGRIGVVLLDIRLPDGIALDAIGRFLDIDRNLVILVMTAYHDDETYQAGARRKGVFDFIAKAPGWMEVCKRRVTEASRFRTVLKLCESAEVAERELEKQFCKVLDFDFFIEEFLEQLAIPFQGSPATLHLCDELGVVAQMTSAEHPNLHTETGHEEPDIASAFENGPRVKWRPASPPGSDLVWVHDVPEQEFPLPAGSLFVPMAPCNNLLAVLEVPFPQLHYCNHAVLDRWRQFCDSSGVRLLSSTNHWLSRVREQEAKERELLANQCKRLSRNPLFYLVGAMDASPLDGLIGSSLQIERVKELARRAAASDSAVLIVGPSGTGKEILARAIHYHSDRRAAPFVAVNCASVPIDLWESLFFGHVKGAFTNASKDHIGFFEEAAGGTLFLDEVGEIPVACQTKLLRVIECGGFRPVGADRDRPMEARIVSATSRPLDKLMESGRFRDELYYRLQVLPIDVPRLAERGRDVIEIAKALLRTQLVRQRKRGIALDPAVFPLLLEHDWPGNVRELENVIERCVLMLSDNQRVTKETLTETGFPRMARKAEEGRYVARSLKRSIAGWRTSPNGDKKSKMEDDIRERITQAMRESCGNVSVASSALGLARGTLYQYIKTFHIALDRTAHPQG